MVMQVRRTLTVGATPTGLAEGQLSVGMADDPPTLWSGVPTSINPSGVVQVSPPADMATQSWVQSQLGDPTFVGPAPGPPSPSEGDFWMNTDDNQLYVYTSGNWVLAATPPSGFLPLAGGVVNPGPVVFGSGQDFITVASTGIAATNASLRSRNAEPNRSIAMGFAPAGSGGGYVATGVGALFISVDGSNNMQCVRTDWVAGTQLPVNAIGSNIAINAAVLTLNYGSTATFSIVSSDARLKTNLEPGGDALEMVNAIPVHACDFKADHPEATAEHWDYSIMAQDVRARMPFAVIEPVDGGYASLHPLHLIATLWRAVQQLTEKVNALEARQASG